MARLTAEQKRIQELEAQLQAQSDTLKSLEGMSKGLEVKVTKGISNKTKRPYVGVSINGPFRPAYLAANVAKFIVLNKVEFIKALEAACKGF